MMIFDRIGDACSLNALHSEEGLAVAEGLNWENPLTGVRQVRLESQGMPL